VDDGDRLKFLEILKDYHDRHGILGGVRNIEKGNQNTKDRSLLAAKRLKKEMVSEKELSRLIRQLESTFKA